MLNNPNRKNLQRNPYTVTEKYIATRKAGFNIEGRMLNLKPEHKDQVYGVIVDITISNTVLASLLCYLNGAANLFFNDGSSYENISANHREVAKIAQAFVISSQHAFQYPEQLQKTTSHPLPNNLVHYVYLLTQGGTYKIEIDPLTYKTNPLHNKLFQGYNTVMNVIKDAQLIDNAK
jgi:hypothetical protein